MGSEDREPTAGYQERLREGRTSVGLYRPRGADPQEPHEQDEVYIVRRGSGTFVRGARADVRSAPAMCSSSARARYTGLRSSARIWKSGWSSSDQQVGMQA